MSARDELLARVRAARGRWGRPRRRWPADYRTAGQPPALAGEALLELLVDRLVDYRALVRRSTTAMVAATVVAALTERGARRVAVPGGILPAGLDRLEPASSWSATTRRCTPAQLDELRRRAHRLRGGDRRDRHDRARRRPRPGPARPEPGARLPPGGGDRRPGGRDRPRGAGPARPGRARRPGSAAPARPATSSWTGSRASTGRGPSRSSSARERP